MRVLHAANWYFPESLGGVEVYVAELARRQRAAGLLPFVAVPEAGTSVSRSYDWEGTPVVRYPMSTPAEGFGECLQRVAPDIVHVHSLSTGLGIGEVAAARRVARRVIFTAHLPALGFTCLRGTLLKWGTELCDGRVDETVCAQCMLESRGLPKPAASAMTTAGRLLGSMSEHVPGRAGTGLRMSRLVAQNRSWQAQLVRDVDAFVGLNRRTLEIVRANGAPAGKLVLNPLGIGFAARRKPVPGERPTMAPVQVGFVGRIHDSKGLRVLMRAIEGLPRDAAIALRISGPHGGPDSADLVRELQQASARDSRIRVGGPLDREQLQEELRRLDVLCCPSMTWENGPTVALEAQAVGTPVIGSDVGAMPEFIADGLNGRLLPPGRWEALRDALAAIARTPSIVDGWRDALPVPRTMDDVARDYERLYDGAPVPA